MAGLIPPARPRLGGVRGHVKREDVLRVYLLGILDGAVRSRATQDPDLETLLAARDDLLERIPPRVAQMRERCGLELEALLPTGTE